jgi:hypothetical protein
VAFDPSPANQLWARQNGVRLSDTAAAAVADASFVVGCSGRPSVDSSVIARLRHGVYLVSASSELYEIDVAEIVQQATSDQPLVGDGDRIIGTEYVLRPNDRHIRLLANGFPINFWGMNSMPDEAADLIMVLLFLAAVELARRTYRDPGVNERAINELADDDHHAVERKFLELHTLG